LFFEPDI